MPNPYEALMPYQSSNARAKPPPTMGEFHMIVGKPRAKTHNDKGGWTSVKRKPKPKMKNVEKLKPGRFRGKVAKVMELHAFIHPNHKSTSDWDFFKFRFGQHLKKRGMRHKKAPMPELGDELEYSLTENSDPRHKGKKIAVDIINLSSPVEEPKPESGFEPPAKPMPEPEQKQPGDWSSGDSWSAGWNTNQAKSVAHSLTVKATSRAIEVTTHESHKPTLGGMGKHFSQFGAVKDITTQTRGNPNRARVVFDSVGAATKALNAGCFQFIDQKRIWVMPDKVDAPRDLGVVHTMLESMKKYIGQQKSGMLEMGRVISYAKAKFKKNPRNILEPSIRLKDVFIREPAFNLSYKNGSALMISLSDSSKVKSEQEATNMLTRLETNSADPFRPDPFQTGFAGRAPPKSPIEYSAPVRGSSRMKFRGGRGGAGRGRGGIGAPVGKIDPLYRPAMAQMPREFENKKYTGRVTTYNIGCGGFILSKEFNKDCPGLAKDGKIFIYRHHLPRAVNKLFPDQWVQFHAFLKHDNIYHARDVRILDKRNPAHAAAIVMDRDIVPAAGPGATATSHGWEEQWEEKLKMFTAAGDKAKVDAAIFKESGGKVRTQSTFGSLLDESAMASGLGGGVKNIEMGIEFQPMDPEQVHTKNIVKSAFRGQRGRRKYGSNLSRVVTDPMMDAFNVNSYAPSNLSSVVTDPMMDAFNVNSYAPPPKPVPRPPPQGRPPPVAKPRIQPPPQRQDFSDFPALGQGPHIEGSGGLGRPPPMQQPPRPQRTYSEPSGFPNMNMPPPVRSRSEGPPAPQWEPSGPAVYNQRWDPSHGHPMHPPPAHQPPIGPPPLPPGAYPHEKQYICKVDFCLFNSPNFKDLARPLKNIEEDTVVHSKGITNEGMWIQLQNGKWAPLFTEAGEAVVEEFGQEGEQAAEGEPGEAKQHEGSPSDWKSLPVRQLSKSQIKSLSVDDVGNALRQLNLSELGKEGELRERLCNALRLDYQELHKSEADAAAGAHPDQENVPPPHANQPWGSGQAWGGEPGPIYPQTVPTAKEMYHNYILPEVRKYPQYTPADWSWKEHLRPILKQALGPTVWREIRTQKLDKEVKTLWTRTVSGPGSG